MEQGKEGYPRAGDKSLGSWTKGPGGPEAGRLMPEDHRVGVGVGGVRDILLTWPWWSFANTSVSVCLHRPPAQPRTWEHQEEHREVQQPLAWS